MMLSTKLQAWKKLVETYHEAYWKDEQDKTEINRLCEELKNVLGELDKGEVKVALTLFQNSNPKVRS